MKRFILFISLILVFVFTALSVAYLVNPSQIIVDLDNLQSVKEKKTTLFLKGSWGKTEGQFGITKGGWLPGPMSLAADDSDRLYILDQENRRIQVFSNTGELVKAIPIDTSTYEDIVVDEGFIYILDPVENHLVKKIDQNGKIIRIYNIADDIEPISGLILAENKVYVEVEHKKIYRIGSEVKALKDEDSQLQTESEGRPADEGFKTEAELGADGQVSAEMAGRYPIDAIKISGETSIGQIISLDSDSNKNLYIVLNVAASELDFDRQKDKLLGLVIAAEGEVSAKFYASNQYYTSHFRKITVSPSGTVYQMLTTPQGVEIWQW